MAHHLTPGFNVPLHYVPALVRNRQIQLGTYPPYEPLYRFLRAHGAPLQFEALATRAGFPAREVSRILKGHAEPYFWKGVALARAIGCTAEELDAYLAEVQRNPLKREMLADQRAKAERAKAHRR